jgi:hypothetical protein
MASKHTIEPTRLSVALTSCGRFDLLETTLASFLDHFVAPRILIGEDAERPAEAAAFAYRHPEVEMRANPTKLGQMRSIDSLYAAIETPYVLHLEDDWEFTAGTDLAGVMDFLQARDDISVCAVGYRLDPRFRASAKTQTHRGMNYLVWDLDAHPKWFSYSFNPSVARLSMWRELGPFARFNTEEGLSAACKARGLRIAMLERPIANHIGDKRHAHDPFQPRRATTLFSRLRRSAAKRWPIASAGERVQCR